MVKKYKIAKICLMLIVMFIGVSIVRFSIVRSNTNNARIEIGKLLVEYENEYLESFLTNAILDYNHSGKLRAQTLRAELLTNMSMEEISNELSGKYSPEFYKHINHVLNVHNPILNENNPGCNTYLANRNGVIAYFSNENRNILNAENGEKTVNWETFYETHPEFQAALYEIMYSNKDYIIVDAKYNILTLDDIISIYNEKGIEGLKGYRILTCAEITEDGDILGNPDSSFMKQNKNYKLYIINSISLYDVVQYEEPYLQNIRKEYSSTIKRNISEDFATNTMLINIVFGGTIFALVAILYSDKFEE